MKTTPRNRRGFTLIEIVIAVAIVAIIAAALSPMVFRHLEDAKVSKAQQETEIIATSVLSYYKDVGAWPYSEAGNSGRPSGNQIRRVLTSNRQATGTGPDPGTQAARWGNRTPIKLLGEYLYYNNAHMSGAFNADQPGDAWPTTGRGAWKGPYIENYEFTDPWGNAYVINTEFFPGGRYNGTVRHKVYVLSAGPNGVWETGWGGDEVAEIRGDDIGTVITIR